MKRWILTLLILLVVIGLTSYETKKEGRFSSRCGEDNSTIEVYNKMVDKGFVYMDCGDGLCKEINGVPTCLQPESKKEEPPSISPILVIGAVLLSLVIFNKMWRKK